MGTLVEVGQAIEGLAVAGQSRHPLRPLSRRLISKYQCRRYRAEHDVSAWITLETDEAQLEPGASISLEDRICCEKALISTTAKKPSERVTKGSGKHQTNQWSFNQRTAVRVLHSHPEIANAIRRRLENATESLEDNHKTITKLLT